MISGAAGGAANCLVDSRAGADGCSAGEPANRIAGEHSDGQLPGGRRIDRVDHTTDGSNAAHSGTSRAGSHCDADGASGHGF